MTAILERTRTHRTQNFPSTTTLQEYFALPEGPPIYEFEAGKLIEMQRPHSRHQKIVLRLAQPIDNYLVRYKRGEIWPEIEVVLPGQTKVYIPDLVCLVTEPLSLLQKEGRIHGAPDLVIEVLSPATRQRDRTSKMKSYQGASVQWYWLAEQADLTIEEFELTDRGYLATQLIPSGAIFYPTLFPDLTINLAELMGEISPDQEEEAE